MQTARPNLNSAAIKLATTDLGTTEIETLHRMTARVHRLVKAPFSSPEHEQEEVRTTRYASEEPSKWRWLCGNDIDSTDSFANVEAAAINRLAATSGGD